MYPFGCLVHVKPNEAAASALPQFAARSVPAIFVCWRLQPGHKWDGQVCVAPLSQFENEPLTLGSFSRAPRTWLTQDLFLPRGNIIFPLKARYDQARYTLPPILVPADVEPSSIVLPGMSLPADGPPTPLPSLELSAADPPEVEETEMDPADADGACPHFRIPPVEEREVGVNWWPPRRGANRPPNISPTQWCLMSSVLRNRIIAETSAWWAARLPPCPPPEDEPPCLPVSPPPTALVARPVHKPEIRQSVPAQVALSQEWQGSATCRVGTKVLLRSGTTSVLDFRYPGRMPCRSLVRHMC